MTKNKHGGSNRNQGRKPNPDKKQPFNRSLSPLTIKRIKEVAEMRNMSHAETMEAGISLLYQETLKQQSRN